MGDPSPRPSAGTVLASYGEDPLRLVSEQLLAEAQPGQIDLSNTIILLPHHSAVPRFRRVLLDTASDLGLLALLPPYVGTLGAWLQNFADNKHRRLSNTGRETLLLEALAEHPRLIERWGAWPLIDGLLKLFDELSLNNVGLPDELDTFTHLLADAYGVSEPPPAPLGDEAQLAFTLWKAWQRELRDHTSHDITQSTLTALKRSLSQIRSDVIIYLIGFVSLSRAEIDWVHALQARRQMRLMFHGQAGGHHYHPDATITQLLQQLGPLAAPPATRSAYGTFLDNVYNVDSATMLERARAQARAQPANPANGRLVVCEAVNFEEEARAVDLQVRRWRLQGLKHIGIVTNDRKLARRVRALLERANVFLNDAAGWALSTTSAATALVRWLDCIEQNFAHTLLFDLLRSPFVSLGLPQDQLKRAIVAFEQGVVLRHNLARDMARYRYALHCDRQLLDERYGQDTAAIIGDLLNGLGHAARPLGALVGEHRRSAGDYLAALEKSLQALGITVRHHQDEAGIQLLRELDDMRTALRGRRLRLSWSEFREWLGRNLERCNFQPPMKGGDVELMGFTESRLYRFDGVIIAGAIRDNLPGQVDHRMFFNDGVRTQLGLPSLGHRRNALFHDFRRLLESATQVTITLRQEDQGETAIASPWVERLRAFCQIAYGSSLEDEDFAQLASSDLTHIVCTDETEMPQPQGYPSAILPKALVSNSLSASAHQRMIDCPYQFFAIDGLSLDRTDDVREELEKRDYGVRVHRILQAFHLGAPGLPGPFKKRLNPDARTEAKALLLKITRAAFADDINSNIFARGWLLRWQATIDPYLDWQLRREQQWRPFASETTQHRRQSDGTTDVMLTARIDRLDQSDQGQAIIDYKTGRVPDTGTVTSGENIQLPFYALTLEHAVTQALFLELSPTKVLDRVHIDGADLNTVTAHVRDRMLALQAALEKTAALPAWGDDQVCAYCDVQGLCRKEMWLETSAEPVTP
ncbi:MAG: PD-(D/E)XK nuclease family protein [Gammaproteobacteria bacterium]|nr:PD-(D/E)XK nuclease family protein [Gammaproteobacteria bacterium]